MRYIYYVVQLFLERIQLLYKFLNIRRFNKLDSFNESVLKLLFEQALWLLLADFMANKNQVLDFVVNHVFTSFREGKDLPHLLFVWT